MIDHWMCLPQCFLWSSDIIYPWFYFLWPAPLFFLPPMAMWILVSFINLELISVLFPLCIHSNHCSGSVGSIFLHFSYLALPSKFIAAAAKSLQSDSVWPHRWQPTRLPRPWDCPGKNTGVGCHFILQCMKVKSENEVAQSCPTLSDPMDCSPPGSSTHGIFQARVLEWGAIAFSEKLLLS